MNTINVLIRKAELSAIIGNIGITNTTVDKATDCIHKQVLKQLAQSNYNLALELIEYIILLETLNLEEYQKIHSAIYYI